MGETVGYRVRFGSKVSRRTRIEVVTEGVFTRLILDDSALDGVAAILLDEFHERSLDGDLSLALARDAAVLVAPPGAGKTTRVPLVLAEEPWARGPNGGRKILVLEPRRIAARAAAERMAKTLG